MWYLLTILIAVCGFVEINAACKECSPYGHSCENITDLVICSNGVKNENIRMSCPAGTVCTDLSVICAPIDDSISSAKPACGSKCDVCETGKSFACTSKTTFALCSANTLTNVNGTCPNNLICDTSGKSICVQVCGVTTYTCDRDPPEISTPDPAPTPTETTTLTPTQTPPLTPPLTPAPQTAAQVCAEKNTVGRFAYANNSCLIYANCRYQGSALVAVANTCPAGTFFNKNTQLCETTKPADCV